MSRCKWCDMGKPFGHYANPTDHLVREDAAVRNFEQCRANWSDDDIARADKKTAEVEARRKIKPLPPMIEGVYKNGERIA